MQHGRKRCYNNHHISPEITSISSYLPLAKRTKLDDALLKILERHTADLIEKYSVLPGPESIKNQESEKSPKEIIRIKREQGEEKQDSTYSIRSTDKVALEEFDLKSALFKHMNKNKTANRNPTNYHLYHALMEALIADEDAMDKEVAVKVKDHKRKHDSDDEEDDDDDEGPSAGSNQVRDEPGKTTMETEVESMVTVPIQQVSSSVPLLILQSSISHLLNQYLLPVKNHSLQLSPPTSALQQSSSVLEMYYNLPPRTVSPDPVAIVASRAVDPVGSPSSTTIDQDEQSTSTSPTNQEIQSQVTHQGPVPQFMAPDHSSSGPVLHEMTSDQIRSDLTPNRQETSVDNISLDLVSNKQKASDYDISGLVPPRKNVVSLVDKTDSS
ncbi:hypothetical protein Tco_1128060 [Tanacetum coccineum]